MVLTVSFVISPVIGLSCHRHQADCGFSNPVGPTKTSARLDAGVEASGPHDFAVREISALVFGAARVHRIPPPRP
jgi:hypothetical protein